MVKVFPSTRSRNPADKLLTEYNLINIVNRLVNQESFIVNYNPESSDESYLSFNLGGYYFEIDPATLGNNTYAGIIVSEDLSDNRYNILQLADSIGYDPNDPVQSPGSGLFLATKEDKRWTYSLQLFEGAGGQKKIPQESRVKFTTNSSTRSIIIDDGDLDS